MLLPKLAAEADPAELRRKTTNHLAMYDDTGKQLFLQTLRLMYREMEKRYNNVRNKFSLFHNQDYYFRLCSHCLNDINVNNFPNPLMYVISITFVA